MKNIFIICSSLILLGGLGFNQYNAGLKNLSQGDTRVEASAGLQTYWFKKSRKELLRDTHYINPVRKVIDDSLYFISRGFAGKSFLF